MQEFNLREMITKALGEMKQQGATAKQLKIYRGTGFGNALRFFNCSGVTDVSVDMLDDYLNKMHLDYLSGNYSEWKWRAVRRGKELLVNYAINGSIELKPLSPWNHNLGRAKQSVIYDKPLKSQLDEPLNLFTIVWKIRKLLAEAGYTESSIKHYTSEGLTVILRKHYEAGLQTYSRSLTDEIVRDKRVDYEKGKTSRQSYQNLRKAAIFISSFVKTGEIDFSYAPMWNTRNLNNNFDKLINEFIDVLMKEGHLKEKSMKPYLSVNEKGLKQCALSLAGTFVKEAAI